MPFSRVPFSLLIRHPRKVISALVDSLSNGIEFNPEDYSREKRGYHLASRRTRRKAGREFLSGFTPISKTLPEDIFIAGYPKSGNTWFNQMVAGIIFGVLGSKSQTPILGDLIPDVHIKTFYRRYRTPMFFKTHHLPRPEYRKVVYLLRDGRDAMVSYWHFRRNVLCQNVDFLDMVRGGGGLFPCKWAEHVRTWARNPYGAEMMIIRYEDLLLQPLAEMRRFARFCQLEIEPDFLQLVVENASFRNLQAMGRRFGAQNETWSKFFRRGVAGSYRDEMPEDVLEAFLADAGEMLRQHRYLT